MLTWLLTKSHWLPTNVKTRIKFLTILGLGALKSALSKGDALN